MDTEEAEVEVMTTTMKDLEISGVDLAEAGSGEGSVKDSTVSETLTNEIRIKNEFEICPKFVRRANFSPPHRPHDHPTWSWSPYRTSTQLRKFRRHFFAFELFSIFSSEIFLCVFLYLFWRRDIIHTRHLVFQCLFIIFDLRTHSIIFIF